MRARGLPVELPAARRRKAIVNRKNLLTLAQVALAVALLAYVLSGVPRRDSVIPKAGATEAAVAVEGTIVGPSGVRRPWEAQVVEFETAAGERKAVDSSRYEVKPGILTLSRYLDVGLYLIGAGLLLVGAFMAFARWWLLVRVLSIPFTYGQAVKWSFVGFFFNNVVPGLVGGDLPKMYFVARGAPNKTHAVLTVAVDRLLGLFGLALVAGVALAFDWQRYQSPELRGVALPIVAVLAGSLVGFVVAGSSRLRGLLLRNPLVRRVGPLERVLAKVDEAMGLYRGRPGVLATALALSCGNHILSMVAWWLFAKALGGTLALGPYFVFVPLIQMAKSVPLTPAGWGVGEALFARLAPLYGESATLGVALSIAYNLTYLGFSLVGGVLLLTSRDRVSASEMQRGLETPSAAGA